MAPHEQFRTLLPKLPFVSPSSFGNKYLSKIFHNREDISSLVNEGHFLPMGDKVEFVRFNHLFTMADQEQKILWVALKDIVRGLQLEGEKYEIAILYQVRTKTGKVLEGDEDPRFRVRTSRRLDTLPSLLAGAEMEPYDGDVLTRLNDEKAVASCKPEILARSLELRLLEPNVVNVHSIRLSLKAGEKLYKKMTESLFEQRREPIVDALRLRILVDSDAYRGQKGAVVEQAHRIFYDLYPNITAELKERSQYDTGCILPQELMIRGKPFRHTPILFTDRCSLLKPVNLRRQLDPEFRGEPGRRILFKFKDETPKFRDQYQFLKVGWMLRGSDLNLDSKIVDPAFIGSYSPALEVQVTTSDAHKANEASSAQTTKSRYVLYDLAKTMVSQWNQASYDVFSNLSKANPFGTMFEGEIPRESYFYLLHEQADAIWYDIVPKLKGTKEDRLEKELKKALHGHPVLKKYCC